MCLNATELDFPANPDPRVTDVGPMVHRPQQHAESTADWRSALAREDDRRSRPLVYCSLGTFWETDHIFLKRVLDVFRRRPDWDLVCGLGGKLDLEILGPLPANVVALAYAPQVEVLSEASCAITHGGITSINECIEMGVPMVMYSTKQVDQNGTTARVVYHGLGVSGDKDRDPDELIEAKIEDVLLDPKYRSKVARMRETFDGYRRPDRAVALIERLAAGGETSA